MDPFIANIVGIAGGILIVAAYAYANIAEPVRLLPYNLVNLAGAILLTLSLLVHFNLASLLLEIVWMAIAIYGIVKALRKKEGPA
ncbi:MAG: CBU_0592 family membrane protein [Parasphingopyxis sp.]